MRVPDGYEEGVYQTTDSGQAAYIETISGVKCELAMDTSNSICTFQFADESGELGWLAMEYNVKDPDGRISAAVNAKQYYSHVRGLWKRISSLKAQRRSR